MMKAIQTRTSADIRTRGSTGGGCEEEPLSPASRLFHEPGFNIYIIAELGSSLPIRPHVVKHNLVHTLLRHPRFSSTQVVDQNGTMRWVPTTVDIDKHVVTPEIDARMEGADEFVEKYISDLSLGAVDHSRPLWDLHLLNVQTTRAMAVGIFRIHHSIGDGMSLMSLLLACTRKVSDPESLPTIPATRPAVFPGGGWGALNVAWNTVVDIAAFLATTMFLRDTETPIKGDPRLGSTRWSFVHTTVLLDDIKMVGKALHTTINDVVLGITIAALARYLDRIYGKRGEQVPKRMRMRACLLVNTRASTGIHALAEMMEKGTEAKWGNHVGFVLLPLPVEVKEDPLDYIRAAKSVANRKKRSLEAFVTNYLSELVFRFLGVKVAGMVSHRVPGSVTISFSNMVGPVEEIGFYGHPMEYIAPGCFGQPNALMINCLSYNNKMTFVVSVDEGTIPDSRALANDIQHSLAIIKSAAINHASMDT